MVKVCHITNVHGVEDIRIFRKECVTLAKAGYDVYLVERGNSYDKNGVHIVGVGDIPTNRWKRMTEGVQKVYEAALKIDADIYHLHDPELLRIALKLKRLGKKVIFDSHELVAPSILEKTYIPAFIRYPIYWMYKWYERYVCTRLDAVIYVTPNLKNYYERLNKKILLITNYPIYEEREILNKRDRKLAFAGGVNENWNHVLIIDAISEIRDCKYELCGPCEQRYLDILKKRVGWEKVIYRGRISHDEVISILGGSMIGLAVLTPCRNTDWQNGTLGNTKIFEEMMAGLPVVCTDFNLWKDIVNKYHCGICIDPSNKKEFVDNVQYLLDNPDIAREMGENGRRAVKEEFNWDTQAVKLLELYEAIGDRD